MDAAPTNSPGSSRCFLILTGAREQGMEGGRCGGWGDKPGGLFATLSGVTVCREAGRLSGNERGQLAGSAEVNS